MRFVQMDVLPEGRALVDVDKLTHAVPQADGGGTRLYLGAQHLDVPHMLAELENVLAGRERGADGQASGAGFHAVASRSALSARRSRYVSHKPDQAPLRLRIHDLAAARMRLTAISGSTSCYAGNAGW